MPDTYYDAITVSVVGLIAASSVAAWKGIWWCWIIALGYALILIGATHKTRKAAR